MAATLITDIITRARRQLRELTPRYWSAAELLDIFNDGAVDMWGSILDLYGDHYQVIDESHVELRANESRLSGVPGDCFRVQLIEPRDTSVDGSGNQIIFFPKKYKSPEFSAARTQSAMDQGTTGVIFYDISGVGAPESAPTILVAPQLSATLRLRLVYNPTLTINDVNPIPGGSDLALKAWVISYAMAKETEDQQPHPGWLGVYSTERQHILTRLTPRQTQEPEIVEDFFAGY